MLAQPVPAVARSVMKFRSPLEGVPYVRSEWRQIKVSSRAKTEHRAQETFPRITGSRDKEIEGNRCSSFREANCGTGMNTSVPFSAKAGAPALRDLPLPRDPEGRGTPSITLDDLLREEMQ